MVDDPTRGVRAREAHRHASTPDTASWDVREDAEIELTGDTESLDEVDLVDEAWAPGQPPPGMPAEEVLHVHRSADLEEVADDLELDTRTRDDLSLASDELFEGEEGEET